MIRGQLVLSQGSSGSIEDVEFAPAQSDQPSGISIMVARAALPRN